ncbi:unnamed protein product, partial [Rotaria magnacalcarata]
MTLCHEDDHELKFVIEQMKKNDDYTNSEKSHLSFCNVLFEMGKYDHAEKYLHNLLNELSPDHEDIARCYDMLGDVARKKDELDLGLEWYSKSLKTKKKKSVTNNPEIGKSYVNISRIHRKKDNLDLAMESLKKALRIFERVY